MQEIVLFQKFCIFNRKTPEEVKIILFYTGATIDIVALLIAAGMMISDHIKNRRATNNPFMLLLVLAVAGIVALAFFLKSGGRIGWAKTALWVPGVPLAAYGLFVLLFVILKPDMK